MKFKKLAIDSEKDLIFGHAPNPVSTRRGLEIGGGIVYPELNFTLPELKIDVNDYSPVINHYKQIVSGALERAVQLHSNGVVLEFETLIEMTQNPDLGVTLISEMNDICEDYFAKHQLKS